MNIVIKYWKRSNYDLLVCFSVFVLHITILIALLNSKYNNNADIYSGHPTSQAAKLASAIVYMPETFIPQCIIWGGTSLLCVLWYLLYIRRKMKKVETLVFRANKQGVYICNVDTENKTPRKKPFSASLKWDEIERIRLVKEDDSLRYIRFHTNDGRVYFFDYFPHRWSYSFWFLKKVFVYFSGNKKLDVKIVKVRCAIGVPDKAITEMTYQLKKRMAQIRESEVYD